VHTMRWVNGLAARGIEVHLATVHEPTFEYDARVVVHRLFPRAPFGYVLSVASLRRLIRRVAPDLLNVHYATGYGLLARLSGFRPTLLSVWGSDVYCFPEKSV